MPDFFKWIKMKFILQQERNSLRNEFIGLKLPDVLKTLKSTLSNKNDSDLQVQLDVFEEQRASDETHVSHLWII